MVGGVESDYSVCPRPLLQFLQFFQFMSDRLRQVTQVTSGYVSLRRRDGTWSSTIGNASSDSMYTHSACDMPLRIVK